MCVCGGGAGSGGGVTEIINCKKKTKTKSGIENQLNFYDIWDMS